MELKLEQYVLVLIIISFLFFISIASWLTTEEVYRDFLLTIAVVHYVMSKLIVIKKKENGLRN
jgi:hypothetical protein